MEGAITDWAGSHVGKAVSSESAPNERDTTWKTLFLSGMHSMPCQRPRHTSGMSVAQPFPVAFMMSYTASCSRLSVRAPSWFMENPVCGPSTRVDGTPESDMITVNAVTFGGENNVQHSSTCRSRRRQRLIFYGTCEDDTEIDVFGLVCFIEGGSMLMNGGSARSYGFY